MEEEDQAVAGPESTRRELLQAAGGGLGIAAMPDSTPFGWFDGDSGAAGGVAVEIPSDEYSLGEFTVTLDAESGQLTVRHPDNDDPLWATRAGENVLAGATVDVDVTERRGSFEVSETVRETYADQTVTAVEKRPETLRFEGTVGDGAGTELDYSLRFSVPSAGHLGFEIELDDDAVDRVQLRYRATADERYYGFGEQYSRLDLRGEDVPIIAQEQGIGRGHPVISKAIETVVEGASGGPLSTYAPMPYYLSSGGHSLCLDNTAYAAFDLTDPGVTAVRVHANTMRGRIFAGETPLDRIERFTEYAGRMDPLPEWVHDGAIVGLQGGTEMVREVLAELEARDTPMAAFWLQDWVGARETAIGKQLWWNWTLDGERYPDWEELRSDLEAAGASLLGYINPYLADPSGKDSDVDRNLYAEAEANGYFVETEDGDPYTVTITDFPSGIVDLSNPDAREWLKGVIREELLGVGLSGWMADFGEALPFDCVLEDADPETYHNRYPVEWAKLNREAIAEADREDAVFFTRSGFTHSPAHSTLFWTGDQMVTWDAYDGYQTAILGLLTGGISGIALNHSDSGGYTSMEKATIGYGREKNLLMRWLQTNAFTTAYRTHEGNQPAENVQFYDSEETYDHFARFAKVYAALQFYREQLFEAAATKGYPVVRHPLLHYPDDETAHRLRTQFMLGSEFMIAPVVEKNRDRTDVYLPAGEWTHVWSGETVDADDGAWFEVAAPIGTPAVFYRAGSTVGEQFVDNLDAAGVLDRE